MSAVDLTEAVARARWERTTLATRRAWSDLPQGFRDRMRDDVKEADIGVIEAAVRAQVAQEIEAEANKRRREADETAAVRGGMRDPHQDSIRAGIALAARIARGGAA